MNRSEFGLTFVSAKRDGNLFNDITPIDGFIDRNYRHTALRFVIPRHPEEGPQAGVGGEQAGMEI